MKPLIDTSIQAPEWTFTATGTPDGEYVTDFVLWRNGEKFASIPAEAEGTPYAMQESGFKALCVAANNHSKLVALLNEVDRIWGVSDSQAESCPEMLSSQIRLTLNSLAKL